MARACDPMSREGVRAVAARDASIQCIFCRIVRGEAPSHPVYEDERTLAFMDIAPVSDGHVLVIPRAHGATIFEVGAEDAAAVARGAKRVAHALREVLSPPGLLVGQLNGEAAGQSVFHYHVHLIPRREGDGLRMHGRGPARPERLSELAASLRAALAKVP